MKRLALFLIVASALLPGAARAGFCSPISCGPSQFTLGGGHLLGFRAAINDRITVVDLASGEERWTVPSGMVGGNFVVHQQGLRLEWYDASRGTRAWSVQLAHKARLAGVSHDGRRAVLLRRVSGRWEVSVVSETATRVLRLPTGRWDVDALHGDRLYLIHYVKGGAYEIRVAHVRSGVVESKPLKDPHESGTIWGIAFSRTPSLDGRYLFTLYIGSNGAAMVHALDLRTATARCIDLPGTGNMGSAMSWGIAVSRDGRRLWAVSPGYKRAVAIDVRTKRVTEAFTVDFAQWNLGVFTRTSLSPDGRRIALTDGNTVAELTLATRKVTRQTVSAVAVGYSPDGRLLRLG